MTTGTVLALIFTCITAPLAIVSGIWLEARMPGPQPQTTGSGQPAPDRLIPGGRHRG